MQGSPPCTHDVQMPYCPSAVTPHHLNASLTDRRMNMMDGLRHLMPV